VARGAHEGEPLSVFFRTGAFADHEDLRSGDSFAENRPQAGLRKITGSAVAYADFEGIEAGLAIFIRTAIAGACGIVPCAGRSAEAEGGIAGHKPAAASEAIAEEIFDQQKAVQHVLWPAGGVGHGFGFCDGFVPRHAVRRRAFRSCPDCGSTLLAATDFFTHMHTLIFITLPSFDFEFEDGRGFEARRGDHNADPPFFRASCDPECTDTADERPLRRADQPRRPLDLDGIRLEHK